MTRSCATIRFLILTIMVAGSAGLWFGKVLSKTDGGVFDEDACLERLESDEKEYLLGLQYLMNCFQWKQYLTIPTRKARGEWIETFWLQLDPTPTTRENERRIEHEMRVALARQHFSMAREPGWDRRGEILIRFGKPDTRSIIDPEISRYGAKPPREEWYYTAFDMLISFADITHNGEYFYDEEIAYSLNSILRERQQDAPQAAGRKVPVWFMFIMDPFSMFPQIQPNLEEPNEGLAEKIEYCHAADTEANRLPAYIDITSFLGGPGMLRTEINFEIPADAIVLDETRDGEVSEIELRVLVRNTGMDSVAFASDCISGFTEEVMRRPYYDLIPGQLCVTLRPGYYRFGMEVIDRKTGRSSSYRRSFNLPVLDGHLALSDILFAGRVSETEENIRFAKGRLEIVPLLEHNSPDRHPHVVGDDRALGLQQSEQLRSLLAQCLVVGLSLGDN